MSGFALRRESTVDQIADQLVAMILRGQYEPGQAIREGPLATSLGVSRNTVREAVRVLEHSGLVRYEMNHGGVVCEPSLEDVRELYELRLIVEPAGLARLALPEGLEPLRSAMAALEEAAASGDIDAIVACDLDFHRAIAAAAGNRRVDQIFARLANELRFYVTVLQLTDREQQRPDLVVAEHRRILDALEAGRRARAAELLLQHIEGNAARLTRILAADDLPRAGLP
jgi:DNA-binding GntR family transcriptional regulator